MLSVLVVNIQLHHVGRIHRFLMVQQVVHIATTELCLNLEEI
jgi:hypothetical protein